MGRYRKKSKVGYGQKYEYPPEFNVEFKRYIRKRDGHICANPACKRKLRLDVHHIDYNKLNTTKANCISLCRDCHKTVHGSTWMKKIEWKHLFWEIAARREREQNEQSRRRII